MNWSIVILCFVLLSVYTLGSSSETTCSSDFKDVSSCTILSDIVFEGQSTSGASKSDRHNVTFRVIRLLKGALKSSDEDTYNPVSVGIFGKKGNENECVSGPVKSKSKYLVFLRDNNFTSTDEGYYRITCSPPVLANSKNLKNANKSACPKCGKKPTAKLSPAKEIKVQVGKQTQVQCNHKGNPQPKVKWFKDNRTLNFNDRILLTSNRRFSKITIKKVTAEDLGFYECQGVNVLGASPKTGVKVTPITTTPSSSTPTSSTPSSTPSSSSHGTPCHDQRLCFNNGTCFKLIQLGLRFCVCAPEFTGARCQVKQSPHGKLEESSPNFLFVVIIGASVAGIFLFIAVIMVVLASLRKWSRARKVTQQLQDQGDEKNCIIQHQHQSGSTDANVKPNPSNDTRLHINGKDVGAQTECLQSSSSSVSRGRDRLQAASPRFPNGKVPVRRSDSTSIPATVSPHPSSSSSGTSASEVDSGEYVIQDTASRDVTSLPDRSLLLNSSTGPPTTPSKAGPGIWKNLRPRKGDKSPAPGVEMKTTKPVETLLMLETTLL